MIIFNHAITAIYVYRKYKYYSFLSYRICHDFKMKVGKRFGIFPKYEKITCVVRTNGLFHEEFCCHLEDFKHDNLYIENGVIYENPHCTIVMNNDNKKVVYFDTVEELETFVEELQAKAPHIEVN